MKRLPAFEIAFLTLEKKGQRSSVWVRQCGAAQVAATIQPKQEKNGAVLRPRGQENEVENIEERSTVLSNREKASGLKRWLVSQPPTQYSI